MNETTVTQPSPLEIRVERVFDAPRSHVFSVWTNPELIPEWWGDGTVVEEMDVRPGGRWRFRTAFGLVEGQFHRGSRRPRSATPRCSTASRRGRRAASRASRRYCRR